MEHISPPSLTAAISLLRLSVSRTSLHACSRVYPRGPCNLVPHKEKEDDAATASAGECRIYLRGNRTVCRVPAYPGAPPPGELFLRRDSTRAALSRLSCPSKENIKLVPAVRSRGSRARAPRCYARQSLLRAFFLATPIPERKIRDVRCCVLPPCLVR